MKNLLKIHDNGSHWKVTDVEQRNDEYIDPGKFFEVPAEIYEYVKQSLKKNEIIISKEKLNSEVKKEDFVLDELEESERLRIQSRNLVYSSMNGRCDITTFMALYNFTLANNYLSSKGFFITEENKDEIYINIIKSEDQKAIEMLEVFLQAKDMLSKPYYWFNEYQKYDEDLEYADTEEEINEVTQNMLNQL